MHAVASCDPPLYVYCCSKSKFEFQFWVVSLLNVFLVILLLLLNRTFMTYLYNAGDMQQPYCTYVNEAQYLWHVQWVQDVNNIYLSCKDLPKFYQHLHWKCRNRSHWKWRYGEPWTRWDEYPIERRDNHNRWQFYINRLMHTVTCAIRYNICYNQYNNKSVEKIPKKRVDNNSEIKWCLNNSLIPVALMTLQYIYWKF